MRLRGGGRRGNTLIEFTLVGIPVIFLLISIFEMSRGMWLYHTLASTIREGTRLAVVHGNSCNLYPNSCAMRIRDYAGRIRNWGIGFTTADIRDLTFVSATRTITCPTLADCVGDAAAGSAYWPAGAPGAAEDAGGKRRTAIEIRATYQFRSAISMFWPGAGSGQTFGTVMLPASSRELIQY